MRARMIAVVAGIAASVAPLVSAAGQGVVATAPADGGAPADTPASSSALPPGGDSTAHQISAWISAAGSGDGEQESAPGPAPPRTIHGEIGAGFGSNGSSGEYGIADVPVGQTGDLVVGGSNSSDHFRGRNGGDGQSLSIGLFLPGASDPPPCRSSDADGDRTAPSAQQDPAVEDVGGAPGCDAPQPH